MEKCEHHTSPRGPKGQLRHCPLPQMPPTSVCRFNVTPNNISACNLEDPLFVISSEDGRKMAVNTAKLLLLAFPVLVLASDFCSIFLNPPVPVRPVQQHDHHHRQYPADSASHPRPSSKFVERAGSLDTTSLGGKFHISFCSSCSYKKTALETRNILLRVFPGTEVVLTNYPPPLMKSLLIKLVPLVQFVGIGLVVGGEYIFPKLGYATPPSWYNSLRQNRFGAAASFWLIGNILQNTLRSTGAFEVFFDGELIFSKLRERRFPEEFELRELVGKTLELKAAHL